MRVGLVGAGPWASLFHAPMVAHSEDLVLSGVWARRPEAADDLARTHGTRAFGRYEAMLEEVDALVFAVPPDVQAELAIAGARAGKALLLEKPIALDLRGAQQLADVVTETGALSQMVLTWRYTDEVRRFLEQARSVDPLGGRGWFLTGGLLGGMFSTPWRLEHGPLFDLGPHVIDLLDAALGPVLEISARGDRHRWVGLQLLHRSGSTSEVSLTAYSRFDPARAGVELYASGGVLEVDTISAALQAGPRIASEFAHMVRSGRPHPLDAQHGLRLQHLLAAADRDLDARPPTDTGR